MITPIISQEIQALMRPNEADHVLVVLWLHGRSANTKRAYLSDVDRLFAHIDNKPLAGMTLADLQSFADSLTGEASTRGRTIAAVKSLLSFGQRIGMLKFNVGAALQKPKSRDTLADRILDEPTVQRLLAVAEGRDHAILRVLYAAGLRVSEAASLRWSDVHDADDGGAFLIVFGKGGKTRSVRVSAATAAVIRAERGDAHDEAPVFRGRAGEPLTASSLWRIVRRAARAAGITRAVSPHCLRHAHASHALDRGALLTVVRDTLGHSSIAVTDRYVHARPGDSSSLSLAV